MPRNRISILLSAVVLAGAVATSGVLAQDAATTLSRSLDKAARSVAAEAQKIAADVTGPKVTAKLKKKSATAASKPKDADPAEPEKAGSNNGDDSGEAKGKDGSPAGKSQYSSMPAQTLPQTVSETPAAAETATHDKGKPAGTWPKTVEDAKAEAEAAKNPKPPPVWSPEEIAEAKSQCEKLLKTIDAVSMPEPAMREGAEGECGTPAPIKLISIGKNPEVAISPPALVTCEMAVALHRWVQKDLQPLSKQYFGAEIIRIENMSDYSCRKAYARVGNKLSEHGKANALDIRGFVTAKAQTAYVLEEWGMTQRDIVAQIAAAKLAADKLAAEKAAQEKIAADKAKDGKSASDAAVADKSGTDSDKKDSKAKLVGSVPGVSVSPPDTRPSLYPPGGTGTGLGFLPPSQLGGPKPVEIAEAKRKATQDAAAKSDPKSGSKSDKGKPEARHEAPVLATMPTNLSEQQSRKSSFLREAHARACKIFGTVLGPEANDAHRNHFHVDMAERKRSSYCE